MTEGTQEDLRWALGKALEENARLEAMMTLPTMLGKSLEFATKVTGIEVPRGPTLISGDRLDPCVQCLNEELDEFYEATTVEGQADALIDLIYFALGRLLEMGVPPGPWFDRVHSANMQKHQGDLSKRPGWKGHDAVKPEGWQPPYFLDLLRLSADQVRSAVTMDFSAIEKRILAGLPEDTDTMFCELLNLSKEELKGLHDTKPKIAVIGHGRHGKDTVGEMLRDDYGLTFTSSAEFCAENVLWPLMQDDHIARTDFLHACMLKNPELHDRMFNELTEMLVKEYADAFECYKDRANHRELWGEAIAAYCEEDPARLAREITASNDVYCGIRRPRELMAAVNEGLFDAVIWVDACERLPKEGEGSMRLEPWMCDIYLDNNGSPERLRVDLHSLMRHQFGREAVGQHDPAD